MFNKEELNEDEFLNEMSQSDVSTDPTP